MREFMSYVLESFRDATDWNRENSYSNLNETADELLNFQPPGGLRLTLSSLATPQFATSYNLGSLGVVDGSISYLYSSVPLRNVIARSDAIPLPTLLRSYRPLRELPIAAPVPTATPSTSILESLRGTKADLVDGARKISQKPTLCYGRLFLPRSQLEALVVKRISPSVQVQLNAVSDSLLRNGGTMLGMLQYDRGQYGIEGLASTDGGLLGLRGLYNFGGDAASKNISTEFAVGNGNGNERERIYGRFSAGGEVYYGTLNKSGGVSLGARFATLPAHRGTPLTATMTMNPLMGNISWSYAVVARDYCSLATKFDFNVFSYESEWAAAMELWSKRRFAGLVATEAVEENQPQAPERKERSFQAKLQWRLDDEPGVSTVDSATNGTKSQALDHEEDYHGVLKARLDQNLKIGLLWEGRMKSLIFSLGTGVDLHKLDQPFRNVGLDIQFSS